MKRLLTALVAALTLVIAAGPAIAQDAGSGSGSGSGSGGAGGGSTNAPDSFNMRASALPVDIAVSAPSALPLDVDAGLAYSGVSVNSQPLIIGEAAPVYVPLLGALGLLGGASSVFGIVGGLAPGLVIGLPTIVGLPPLPIDPTLIPLAQILSPLSAVPIPPIPELGCFTYYPGSPEEASCGGPIQSVFGFEGRGASATTKSTGKTDDPSSLQSKSSAAVLGIDPAQGNTLLNFSAGAARSAASADIQDGRAEAGASTSLADVSIAGAIRIASLDSSVTAALDGTKEHASFSDKRCALAGVTIAGVPIELRPSGFVLANQATLPVPLDAATSLVNSVLQQAHVAIGSGPVDPGILQITPYPGAPSTLADDGTEFNASFGCLQIRYRIPVSGTDVNITLGKVALQVGAYAAAPFDDTSVSSDTGTSGDSGSTPDSSLTAAPSTDLATDLGGASTSGGSTGSLPAPKPPKAGAGTPPVSSKSFSKSSSPIAASTWSMDGGWLAPFALLALAVPVLAKARRFSIPGGSR